MSVGEDVSGPVFAKLSYACSAGHHGKCNGVRRPRRFEVTGYWLLLCECDKCTHRREVAQGVAG